MEDEKRSNKRMRQRSQSTYNQNPLEEMKRNTKAKGVCGIERRALETKVDSARPIIAAVLNARVPRITIRRARSSSRGREEVDFGVVYTKIGDTVRLESPPRFGGEDGVHILLIGGVQLSRTSFQAKISIEC